MDKTTPIELYRFRTQGARTLRSRELRRQLHLTIALATVLLTATIILLIGG